MAKNKLGIAAIFKNEFPFILEWLAYHRVLGISKFFIADNESDDGTSDLLRALSNVGYLKCISYKTEKDIKPQLAAYQLLANNFKDEVEWLCYIDADEFLHPADLNVDIQSSLRNIFTNDQIGAVAINWAVYGSSNWITANSQPVIARFTQRGIQERGVNRHYKTLIRMSAYDDVGSNPHAFKIKKDYFYTDVTGKTLYPNELDGLSDQPIWLPLRVNHYVVKSRSEFFTKKRPRGRPNGSLRPIQFFSQHDMNDMEEKFPVSFINLVIKERNKIIRRLKSGAGYIYSVETNRKEDELFSSTENNNLRICVDSVNILDKKIQCKGWIIGENCENVDFKLLLDYKKMLHAVQTDRILRLDVARAHQIDSNFHYGFVCTFDLSQATADFLGNSVLELCIGLDHQSVSAILPLTLKDKV